MLTGGPDLSAGEREGKGGERPAGPRPRKGRERRGGGVGPKGRVQGEEGEREIPFFSKTISQTHFSNEMEFKTLYKIPHIT